VCRGPAAIAGWLRAYLKSPSAIAGVALVTGALSGAGTGGLETYLWKTTTTVVARCAVLIRLALANPLLKILVHRGEHLLELRYFLSSCGDFGFGCVNILLIAS
jgi:hypothetical protein